MASSPNGELNLDLQLHYGEIHAKARSRAIHVAPGGSRELKRVISLASPRLTTSSTMIEESTGFVAAQPMGMTFESEKDVPSAGYSYNTPLPSPPLFVAADPLQLSIGTHAPAVAKDHMPGSSSSSIAFCSDGINLNLNLNLLLPPEKKKKVDIPNNASPSLENKKPYEGPRPLLCSLTIGKKKDHPAAPFTPVILESSELPAADHELSHGDGAARCNNMAPAKAKNKRRRYIWPANKVARLDEKIEQLRKEALLKPAERRSMLLIEKDIDKVQDKKDAIHARMLDEMRKDEEEGEGSSTQ